MSDLEKEIDAWVSHWVVNDGDRQEFKTMCVESLTAFVREQVEREHVCIRGEIDAARVEGYKQKLAELEAEQWRRLEYSGGEISRLHGRIAALEAALETADILARWEPMPNSTGRQDWLDYQAARAKTKDPK